MNEKKFCFIICYNDDIYLQDALLYIEKLNIPEGFTVENRCIYGASSMTSGYQTAMESSDAKYKIYMHQDVCILNLNFLSDILNLFELSENIGMIGMVGTKKLPSNGCMWTTPMRTGALRYYTFSTMDTHFDVPISNKRGYTYVEAIDGLMIITQYDLNWRTDLFKAWDFYDISQSMEFRNAGYRIVVPAQETPWTLHNDDFNNFSKYHNNRKIFLQEYFPENIEEIALCDIAYKNHRQTTYDKTEKQLSVLFKEKKISEIYAFVCNQIENKNYNKITSFLFSINKIFEYEIHSSIRPEHSIYAIIFEMDLKEVCDFFKKTKLYMMRKFYHLSTKSQQEADDFFKEMGLSKVALAYLHQLVKPEN